LLAVATAGPEARTNEIRAKNMKQLFLIGSFLALLTVATLAAPADDLTPGAKTPEATVLYKVGQLGSTHGHNNEFATECPQNTQTCIFQLFVVS